MSWASQRRNKYIGSVLLVLFLVAVWIAFSIFYESPTCFDGERNGEEDGIDCGGGCELVCNFQAVDPIILWSRFFELSPGLYNAVVLVENPNTNTQAGPTPYSLKLRDANNILVSEINGEMALPAERTIPLFIPSIATGERVPVRSTFTFEAAPVWEKTTGSRPDISIFNTVLSNAETAPRLNSKVRNNSLTTVSDMTVVAILSDANDNAVAVSQTVVSLLDPNQETDIVFTWPNPFENNVASIDVIPTFPLEL